MVPSNLDAAMTMRFATSGCKPESLDALGNRKRQQSCSSFTKICNQRAKKRIELRTHEQPLVAEHRGGTDSRSARAQPHPSQTGRYLSSPDGATLHGKTQGFLPRLSPKTKPMQHPCKPLQCILQHEVANPHLSTHMARQNDSNHAAVSLRSATREPRNA